jgi:hypothetical protein
MKRYTTDAQDRARRRHGMAYEIRPAVRPDPRRAQRWLDECVDFASGVALLAALSALAAWAVAAGWGPR